MMTPAACFSEGFPLVASAALVLLVIAFAGLLRGGHAILYGTPPREPAMGAHGWRAALPRASAPRSTESSPSWCPEMAEAPIPVDLLQRAVIEAGASGVASLSARSIECRLPSP